MFVENQAKFILSVIFTAIILLGLSACGEDGKPVSLVILGMGKLGGRELNFSSDIDLIFLYPEGKESDGPKRLSAQ